MDKRGGEVDVVKLEAFSCMANGIHYRVQGIQTLEPEKTSFSPKPGRPRSARSQGSSSSSTWPSF